MKVNFTLRKVLYLPVITSALLLGTVQQGFAQKKKLNVLFLGNSYTAYNDLPLMVKQVAISVGDTLNVDFNAPGGARLMDHAVDGITAGKISMGTWNYVVLQEQSQMPAFSDADVEADVFPYAKELDSFIHDRNKCARTVFYRTWARKYGDADFCPSFPPICTYEGMDSMLARRYKQMAVANKGLLAPVGDVFKEIKTFKPGIELYQPDNSHPTDAGTYAAAVTFYTILFRKEPSLITFNYTLAPADAAYIRSVVSSLVYTKLANFFVGDYDPDAAFTSAVTGKTVDFDGSTSTYTLDYDWDFGDGGTATLEKPSHTYATAGTYNVRLIVSDCLMKDTVTHSVTIAEDPSSIKEKTWFDGIRVFPNPAGNVLNIEAASGVAFKQVSLDVTNVVGMNVMHHEQLSAKSISVGHLQPGVYFLGLTDRQTGEKVTLKFVKE